MIIHSQAPLRIGLAGGGTDVSPYFGLYGGAVLNVTISLFAHAVLKPLNDKKIYLHASDMGRSVTLASKKELALDGQFDLMKGVYNRIVRDFTKEPLSFELTTSVDVPPGSGLGSSSTLVVALVGVFAEWLKLPLDKHGIARLAYEIERIDLGMKGGKQDQYAAAFGGLNFIEFPDENRVVVNPLRIPESSLRELERNLILFSTGTSRISSKIVAEQSKNIKQGQETSVQAMHSLKAQAQDMRKALVNNRLDEIGGLLHSGWLSKKATAKCISNSNLDAIYAAARGAGAIGGKISGAGGGGHMVIYAREGTRSSIVSALTQRGVVAVPYDFVKQGLRTWTTTYAKSSEWSLGRLLGSA